MNRYKAFGFKINSDFAISQLEYSNNNDPADIIICKRDLSEFNIKVDHYRIKKNELLFNLSKAGIFHITNGSQIEVDPASDCTETLLGSYLMGSCMGAILHQRGFLPLHGSCVTDGKRSVLITGDSGAGKSTLAAEFLSHGWKLITDDVAAVYNIKETPIVQSSYPSQKLWEDSIEYYQKNKRDIHSLYFDENREKFGVNVSEYFYDGACPLNLIVRLIPSTSPCHIEPIGGMTRVDQLIKNTYRLYMIEQQDRENHFRSCVAMAQKVPMALVLRQVGVQCANTLYKMIRNYLGGMMHNE